MSLFTTHPGSQDLTRLWAQGSPTHRPARVHWGGEGQHCSQGGCPGGQPALHRTPQSSRPTRTALGHRGPSPTSPSGRSGEATAAGSGPPPGRCTEPVLTQQLPSAPHPGSAPGPSCSCRPSSQHTCGCVNVFSLPYDFKYLFCSPADFTVRYGL